MQTVFYRRWSPPQSPLRIEFSPELFRSFLFGCSAEVAGVLYGHRIGQDLRLTAALTGTGPEANAHGAPLVGMFVQRPRGEVFLTENDLERFESLKADVALVMSGERGGFFVRDQNGAVQAIRSYEEFALRDTVAQPPKAAKTPAPVTVAKPPAMQPMAPPQVARFQWAWAAVAAAIILVVPIGGLAYLRPLLPVPYDLKLASREGQLLLSWNPQADTSGGQIEIIDGGQKLVATVRPGQSHATFPIRNGNILATLRGNTDHGPGRIETVGISAEPAPADPAPDPASDRELESVTELEQEAEKLRAGIRARETRIAELSLTIRRLTAAIPGP